MEKDVIGFAASKDKSARRRVIVTGGTGFVGANLVRRLLAEGHEVHLAVRGGYASWRLAGVVEQVSIHEARLHEPDDVEALIASVRPEWVFHLAAHGAYSWQTDLAEMKQTNIAGTETLLRACLAHGCEAFVNTGSSSEYGFKDHAPPEDEEPEPNSDYARTKVEATQICQALATSEGANVTTLRLYSVYGPWEDPNRLIPKLIEFGLKGGYPPLADPDIARDFVNVDDVMDAYLLAAARKRGQPGAIYNIGTGIQTTIRDAVDVSRKTFDIESEPDWGSMPNRNWDATVWVSTPKKAERELGWKARTIFEQGFRRTVDWTRGRLKG